jgi:Flp pilus assembly protein TadD
MYRSDVLFNPIAPSVKRTLLPVIAATLAALLMGACANVPKLGDTFMLSDAKDADKNDPTKPQQTELEKALTYWGKENEKNPRDLKAAVSYSKNLKAAGQKERALAVLQAASVFHGSNRELASEYGRLALDAGQTSLAQKLLEAADDPANPDWKIISARGTTFAKQGQYKQAIPLYERALVLQPNQPSIVSNLAMAHAANGEAQKAEALLRSVAEAPDSDPKVRQNLALVLGLQGKYDEAKIVSAKDIPVENAAANVEYVRQMVRAPAQGAPKSPVIQQAVDKRSGTEVYSPPRAGGDETTAAAGGAWAANVTTGSTIASAPNGGLKPSAR